MKKFSVTGMGCAACSARVEKAVSALPGVESCAVSLLTNSMGVEGTATADEIISAVKKAGYGASLIGGGDEGDSAGAVNHAGDARSDLGAADGINPSGDARSDLGAADDINPAGPAVGRGGSEAAWRVAPTSKASGDRSDQQGRSTQQARAANNAFKAQEEALRDVTTPKLRKRLIASVIFMLILMYFSMGHMMWGWPIPEAMEAKHFYVALAEFCLCTIILVINRAFFINGFKGILRKAPNMDTLVAMGSGVSYIWSIYNMMEVRSLDLDCCASEATKMAALDNLYFESAAMIVTLITVGKMLESMSKGRTTDALRSLLKMAPDTAIVIRDGEEVEVSATEIGIGDVFVVKPGGKVPVDGKVIEGETSIDESALTGESLPVDKGTGDLIQAATINQQGYIKARATRIGEDTTFAQVIQLVSDAASTKAPIARLADKVAGIFVPAVLGIATLVFIIWMLVNGNASFALTRAIAVVVISCPCALGLATPVAIMVGSGVGAKNGILFKTAASLEQAGRVQIVALDKTGTITQGKPEVSDVLPADGFTRDDLLDVAGALEGRSEHPIATAITNLTGNTNLMIHDFQAVTGKGLAASMIENGKAVPIAGGNTSYMIEFMMGCGKTEAEKQAAMKSLEDIEKKLEGFSEQGKTTVFFAKSSKLLGAVSVADAIKDDSAEAIAELRSLGIKTVMITGDAEGTAHAIADQVGVDEVVAGVLPDGKEEVIRSLKEQGVTAMVGDGINDAPALTRADLGVAIGAGTEVAIDAADVVLMNSSIKDVARSIRLGQKTLKNIKENLFWAFFYNVLLIPLAAGAYTVLLSGWTLSPMIAAAAMSLSSFTVCMNALRLGRIKL